MKLDIAKIERSLFDRGRTQIERDYGIVASPRTPAKFIRAVLATFQQRPVPEPQEQSLDNRAVFRAAVRAIASHGRRWVVFLAHEPTIREKLLGYEPKAVCDALALRPGRLHELKMLMPGQSLRQDTESILHWARRLSGRENYYEQQIRAVARRMSARESNLRTHELMLTVVGYMANPPQHAERQKLPGFSYVLGTEFLRNLGWSGFKANRRIERLFTHWEVERHVAVHEQVERLRAIIEARCSIQESHRPQLLEHLKFSLLGVALTPEGCSVAKADNLVSMLANYVETAGAESDATYLTK